MSQSVAVHFTDGTVETFSTDVDIDQDTIQEAMQSIEKDPNTSICIATTTGQVLVPFGRTKFIEWRTIYDEA